VVIYGVVLLLISTLFVASLASRAPMRVDVVRDRASLARLVDDGRIENVYRLQLMNATEQPQRYGIEVQGIAGVQLAQPAPVEVAPAQARWVTVAVRVPPASAKALGRGAHPLQFRITPAGNPDGAVNEKSTFVVPR
jgi:polyferredoxin